MHSSSQYEKSCKLQVVYCVVLLMRDTEGGMRSLALVAGDCQRLVQNVLLMPLHQRIVMMMRRRRIRMLTMMMTDVQYLQLIVVEYYHPRAFTTAVWIVAGN